MGAGAGAGAGVTVAEGAERAPAPWALTARTWKVYAVRLVSPVSTALVAVAAMEVTVWSTVAPELTTTS